MDRSTSPPLYEQQSASSFLSSHSVALQSWHCSDQPAGTRLLSKLLVLKGFEGLLCPFPHHRHASTVHHFLLHRASALHLVRGLPNLSWLLWGAGHRQEGAGHHCFDLDCSWRSHRWGHLWLLWASYCKTRQRPDCSVGFHLVDAGLLPHLLGNPKLSEPQ